MTTPLHARRNLFGHLRCGRGSVASSVLACAMVLASRPSLAGPSAAAEPAEAPEPAAEPSAEPVEDDMLARAMAAYERGTKNYNAARYEDALADFTEAASLYASPDFQYNIGLCYEKLGKYDEAIRAFSTYLRAKPDAEDRPNVENRIQMLQQELERRERETEAARDVGAASRPPPEPAQPVDDAPPPATNAGRPLIVSGAALAGVGGAVALAGGIAFGVLAGKRSAAVDEVQTGGNPEALSFDEARELEREGKRFENIQVGMVAGGAVVAVTGAVLLALGLRKRQAARPQARLGPTFGPGTAGLVLTGRF